MKPFLFAALLMMLTTAPPTVAESQARECVILVHGLARSASSMRPMQAILEKNGYATVNVDYPSRSLPLAQLSGAYLTPAVEQCRAKGVARIHFVTHSMGGILVRQHLRENRYPELGNVLMLAPPNQGSELIDRLASVPGFAQFHGPSGMSLGTRTGDAPNRLGPVHFPVGVIAGSRSVNPFLSLIIPGIDDGKVSIERAAVSGMDDFLVLPVTHPLIMRNAEVHYQTLRFLREGHFDHSMQKVSPRIPRTTPVEGDTPAG